MTFAVNLSTANFASVAKKWLALNSGTSDVAKLQVAGISRRVIISSLVIFVHGKIDKEKLARTSKFGLPLKLYTWTSAREIFGGARDEVLKGMAEKCRREYGKASLSIAVKRA